MVSILPLSINLILYFLSVPTVCYFLFFIFINYLISLHTYTLVRSSKPIISFCFCYKDTISINLITLYYSKHRYHVFYFTCFLYKYTLTIPILTQRSFINMFYRNQSVMKLPGCHTAFREQKKDS